MRTALTAAAYRLATTLAGPLVPGWLSARGEKEDRARRHERMGAPQRPRPEGKLVWLHGASVGETLSALPLLECLLGLNPNLSVLVTSGTRTSADLLQKRLPPRALHQYVPLDTPMFAKRFVRHWRPDAVLWLESDLWPNLLGEVRKNGTPAALLNARLSPRSAETWKKNAPGWISEILSTFSLGLAQTEDEALRLQTLGLQNARAVGNLKYTAPSLGVDQGQLGSFKTALGTRRAWVMASTHEGEEDIAARAHRDLRGQFPGLLTIIAPRHPARGDAVTAQLETRGYKVARRSKNEMPTPDTDIFLADTLGEMGLFYRLAPIACIGGSFLGGYGGHNPIEPAQCAAAVICGPDMRNFAAVADDLIRAGALFQIPEGDALPAALAALWNQPTRLEAAQKAAQSATARQDETLQSILSVLDSLLGRAGIKALEFSPQRSPSSQSGAAAYSSSPSPLNLQPAMRYEAAQTGSASTPSRDIRTSASTLKNH